jgi:hypothetical protein
MALFKSFSTSARTLQLAAAPERLARESIEHDVRETVGRISPASAARGNVVG